jgi:hypothetical protein
MANLERLRRWRLGGRTRKALLVAHITAAGAWIGLDVVMGVFVFTAAASDDVRIQALCYQALALFAVWPMVTLALASLVTGLTLGLGTRYGLLRYWWVATKLALNIALATLVLVALRPGVVEVAEYGRRLAAGEAVAMSVTDLYFPPIVSTSALLVAVVLSVYKPWGRIRRSAHQTPQWSEGQERRRPVALRGRTEVVGRTS